MFVINLHFDEKTNDVLTIKSNITDGNSNELADDHSSQVFYHGTKAILKRRDLIKPGFNSNYGIRKQASYVYLTATFDAAIWEAELAIGDGIDRIYIVEPTGLIEDDPNLTNKKFPGYPTFGIIEVRYR